jgi:hypothetical protein
MGGGVGRRSWRTPPRVLSATGADRMEVIASPRATGFYESVGFRARSEVATRFGPAVRMQLDGYA